jgi:DNA polymerase elongation subunit (family B)
VGFNSQNAALGKLVLDIETMPVDGADGFLEAVSAPANYKDPDKIAAYQVEKLSEQLARAALDPDLCALAAVGYQYEDDPLVVYTFGDTSEPDMLAAVWENVEMCDAVIGYNVLNFDLPVLIRRSQYLGVKVPVRGMALDRYRTPHVDLMQRLSFDGKLKFRGLDFYCRRFNVEVPDEHCGKDIGALVQAADWAGVAAHCRADVAKTRALAIRLGYIRTTETADVL